MSRGRRIALGVVSQAKWFHTWSDTSSHFLRVSGGAAELSGSSAGGASLAFDMFQHCKLVCFHLKYRNQRCVNWLLGVRCRRKRAAQPTSNQRLAHTQLSSLSCTSLCRL